MFALFDVRFHYSLFHQIIILWNRYGIRMNCDINFFLNLFLAGLLYAYTLISTVMMEQDTSCVIENVLLESGNPGVFSISC